MTQYIEQYWPDVMQNGLNTLKPAIFGGGITVIGAVVQGNAPVVFTTTGALTAAQSGSIVQWNAAAGFTITLPAPVVGLTYSMSVGVSVTSSNHKIITNAASVFLLGGLQLGSVAGTNAITVPADGSTIRAVTMNGSTTGGLIGTNFNLTCISLTQWIVEGTVAGSGTVATPFATS